MLATRRSEESALLAANGVASDGNLRPFAGKEVRSAQ